MQWWAANRIKLHLLINAYFRTFRSFTHIIVTIFKNKKNYSQALPGIKQEASWVKNFAALQPLADWCTVFQGFVEGAEAIVC